MLADYASTVDYFDHGVVSKDFIARDCSGYVKSWPEITLQITGPIEVRESGAGEYTVSFGYDFEGGTRPKPKSRAATPPIPGEWRTASGDSRSPITARQSPDARPGDFLWLDCRGGIANRNRFGERIGFHG